MIAIVRVSRVAFSAGIPMAFFRVHCKASRVLLVVVRRLVKDEELGLRSDVDRVRNTCKFQITFGSNSDRSRVKRIPVLRDRLHDVCDQA